MVAIANHYALLCQECILILIPAKKNGYAKKIVDVCMYVYVCVCGYIIVLPVERLKTSCVIWKLQTAPHKSDGFAVSSRKQATFCLMKRTTTLVTHATHKPTDMYRCVYVRVRECVTDVRAYEAEARDQPLYPPPAETGSG